jgi:hypothetical protein
VALIRKHSEKTKKLISIKAKKRIGIKASNYKHGKYCRDKIVFCQDCNKQLNKNAYYRKDKRCLRCHNIYQLGKPNIKNKGINNGMYGKPSPRKAGIGIGDYYYNIWLRSSYEIAYAKYLTKNKIKWQYEPKTFNLGSCTYRPDFYLPESDTYIEIKGWWRDDAKKKFRLFKKIYSNIKIIVFDKKKLQDSNIIK